MSLNQQMQQASAANAQHVFKQQPQTAGHLKGLETLNGLNGGNHSEGGEPNGGTFENLTVFHEDTGDSVLRQTVGRLTLNNSTGGAAGSLACEAL